MTEGHVIVIKHILLLIPAYSGERKPVTRLGQLGDTTSAPPVRKAELSHEIAPTANLTHSQPI